MISLISAIGKDNEIGYKNDLIWHIKEDMRRFKNITMGKKIVMGTNTYKSLPRELKRRKYILLSNSINHIDNGYVFDEYTRLLSYLMRLNEEVLIIGGESIYNLFIDYASKMYLTEIKENSQADRYFPSFDKSEWHKELIKSGIENNINYEFATYSRKIKKLNR